MTSRMQRIGYPEPLHTYIFKQKGHVATFNANLYKVTSDLHII